jgi:hypothetical protein
LVFCILLPPTEPRVMLLPRANRLGSAVFNLLVRLRTLRRRRSFRGFRRTSSTSSPPRSATPVAQPRSSRSRRLDEISSGPTQIAEVRDRRIRRSPYLLRTLTGDAPLKPCAEAIPRRTPH